MFSSSSPPAIMSNVQDNIESQDLDRENQNASRETRAREKRKRDGKEMAPRSSVWNRFSRLPENRDRCKCNYCGAFLKCGSSKSGTSSLKNHNSRCKEYKLLIESKSQPVLGHNIDCVTEMGACASGVASECGSVNISSEYLRIPPLRIGPVNNGSVRWLAALLGLSHSLDLHTQGSV